MHKESVKYVDFNNEEKERTLYFNLTKAELVKLQKESDLGIEFDLTEAVKNKDTKALLDFIEKLVHSAYGIKSNDGEHFEKSPEITSAFENSAVYSPFYMELFDNGGAKAIKFIELVMPPDLIKQAEAQMRGEAIQDTRAEVEKNYAPNAREIFEQQKKVEISEEQQPVVLNQPTEISKDEAERAQFEAWKASRNQ